MFGGSSGRDYIYKTTIPVMFNTSDSLHSTEMELYQHTKMSQTLDEEAWVIKINKK